MCLCLKNIPICRNCSYWTPFTKSMRKAGRIKQRKAEPGMPKRVENWSEEEALAFFHFVHTTYNRAESNAGGGQERHFLIAGRPVRMQFAGPGLIPALTPALEHLKDSPGSPPELTVLLWDSASTGTALPAILLATWMCWESGGCISDRAVKSRR